MDIEFKSFSDINLQDTFFDSLREDYPEFNAWFLGKSATQAKAFVADQNGHIIDFLYLKKEDGELGEADNIVPSLPAKKRLKIGTFKIEPRFTKRGERFIKKIMDIAIWGNYEEIYVTIFPKHERLIKIFRTYGFEEQAHKNHENGEAELVLIKNMHIRTGEILKDYPKVYPTDKEKYVLSIYPKYHTKLFPDSILNNEEGQRYQLIKDISPTNGIHKIYLCFMKDVDILKRGDILAIYRTSDRPGAAYYRSVITSICTVEEIKQKKDFHDIDEYIKYTNQYSIFNEQELREWFKKPNIIVIKMLYNIALEKRVTRQYLIEELGVDPFIYWGFFKITDDQFKGILKKGGANENYIVY